MGKIVLKIIAVILSILVAFGCKKVDIEKEIPTVLSPVEMLAKTSKKEWLIKVAKVEVVSSNSIKNTYNLALDCEIDDIWEFHNSGVFYKYDNLTKCKGESNNLKVLGNWSLDETTKTLNFTKWRFLNNKEMENVSFSIAALTDSSFTLNASKFFPNTEKLSLEFKKK